MNIRFLIQLALLAWACSTLAASMTLGPSDAGKCYQASLFPLASRGVHHCDEAIRHGALTKRDLAATYSNRGIIHLRNGKLQKAIQDQDRAVQLQPKVPQFHTNRGNALYYTHDYEDAIKEFDTVINDPEMVSSSTYKISLYNKALAQLKLHRFSDAKTTLETALKADPDSKRIKDRLQDIASLDDSR